MGASLTTVLRRNHDGPGTAVAVAAYPDLVTLAARMQAEDPRIIFDSLRPIGDEFWNMMNGKRTVEEIARSVCLEFGFELSPKLFLPLADGMVRSNAVSVVTVSPAIESEVRA